MIVTLAGHVDHGKTSLVRALTGTDTDRLAEEQRRGLTIDLGFAYLDTPAGMIGFVDVPGHHRFIHNMVAGVAEQQFALLAIAADDGPMPQSREHLQILRLLGLSRGVIALTKCDRVDPVRVSAARDEIRELVADSFLADAPIIETSSTTGAGLEHLKTALQSAASDPLAVASRRPFRLAIDRAFSLRGAGLVVTGTVHSGSIRIDDEVFHFPSGKRARVRGLHVQNRPAEHAGPGDRAAINLAGPALEDLARGNWLCAAPDPGHRHLVIQFDAATALPEFRRTWLPVHIYHATQHSTGRMTWLNPNAVADGGPGFIDIDCDLPLLARHGDRIVIRDQGLDRTLGGGRVIDNRLRPRRRSTVERVNAVAALAGDDPAHALAALLALGPVDLEAFARVWDLTPAERDTLAAASGGLLRGQALIASTRWQDWQNALRLECETRHREDTALQGLQENGFAADVPTAFRTDLLRELVASGTLSQRAGRYLPAGHAVQLSPHESSLLARLEPHLDSLQPPSLGDLSKYLRMPLPAVQKGVRGLIAKGRLVEVNEKRIYKPAALRALAEKVIELGKAGPFTAAAYRDTAGIGRNIAIDLLEYFDAHRLTRRQGETRIVVGDLTLLPGA